MIVDMCEEIPWEPAGGGVYCSHDWISDMDCFHYLYCYKDLNPNPIDVSCDTICCGGIHELRLEVVT